MCYWVLGFAFGLSPLSLTRLYHGITVLSSPNFEPLKRWNVKKWKLKFSGVSEPSCFPLSGVALELGTIIAGITGKVKRYYRKCCTCNKWIFALYYNYLIRENGLVDWKETRNRKVDFESTQYFVLYRTFLFVIKQLKFFNYYLHLLILYQIMAAQSKPCLVLACWVLYFEHFQHSSRGAYFPFFGRSRQQAKPPVHLSYSSSRNNDLS